MIKQVERSIPKFSKRIKASAEEYYVSCPEAVAKHLAERLSRFKTGADLCCMVGATVIQMAKKMEIVYGVDINKKRIEKAQYNAKLYKVDRKTKFIIGNALDEKILKKIKAEVAILDPGWRLPGALPYSFVSLAENTRPNLKKLFCLTKKNITSNMVLRIPPNFTRATLRDLGACEIENIITKGKIRFKLAYFFKDISNSKMSNVHFPDFGYPDNVRKYVAKKLNRK
jgi:hypothetical protein